MHCLSVSAEGVEVCWGASDAQVLDRVERELLLPTWPRQRGPARPGQVLFEVRSAPKGEPAWAVFESGRYVASTTSLELLLHGFEPEFSAWVAAHCEALVVHAATVRWKGHLIVLPGRSFTGKSTLTHALCRAGATYYSDEFAVLHPRSGMVSAYPRPLTLRQSGGRIAAPELNWTEEAAPPALPSLCLVSSFQLDAPVSVEPLSRGAACLELLRNGVNALRFGGGALPVLSRSLAGCSCFRWQRPDAAEAVAWVERQLSLLPPAAPEPARSKPASKIEPAGSWSKAPGDTR